MCAIVYRHNLHNALREPNAKQQHTKQIYRCRVKRTKDDFTVNGFYLSGRLLFHLREIIRIHLHCTHQFLLSFFFSLHIVRHPSNIWVSSKQTSYSQNNKREKKVGPSLSLSLPLPSLSKIKPLYQLHSSWKWLKRCATRWWIDFTVRPLPYLPVHPFA